MTEMMVRENRVLKAIGEGRKALGYQMTFPSVWDVEILGRLDFDYVWLVGWRAWAVRIHRVRGNGACG